MKLAVVICLVIVIQFLDGVAALSSGAPSMACGTMTPMHFTYQGKPPEDCPFTTTQSKLSYGAENDTVTVKLTVKASKEGRTFRGFLIKAINPMNNKAIGQFRGENVNLRNLCHAATHTDASDKTEVVLEWTPKDVNEKNNLVVFETTFVETFRQFYVSVPSTFKGKPAVDASKDGQKADSDAVTEPSAVNGSSTENEIETEKVKEHHKPTRDPLSSFWFE